ncbi:unnamed protein product [Nyctereutes procyonoides]|uniref:(raccoon dog) hypothetical protein n=1 Tax=Nyctereutes procyonoides TaxID=34880 RepID=A0A811YAB2_NYCPR|nr:unnamed protein product [Nyctereutes procyonoides]
MYSNSYRSLLQIKKGKNKKRTSAVAQLKQLQAESGPVMMMFDPETTRKMPSTRDGRMLVDSLEDFRQECLDTSHRYEKFQYECGHVFTWTCKGMTCWNVFTSLEFHSGENWPEILMWNWDASMEDLTGSPFKPLRQQTWLIHWSWFVFFTHPKGHDNFIDLFLYQPQCLDVIQMMCPLILHHLTTPTITNKTSENPNGYPVTKLVECLSVNFGFSRAQEKLRDCESVLMNDFLVAYFEDFTENAPLIILETFYSPTKEAERWLINVIINARLGAKTDSKLGHVVMGDKTISPYQQVMEKTRSLSFRSQMFAMNIEKKLNQNSRSEAPNWAAQDSGFY